MRKSSIKTNPYLNSNLFDVYLISDFKEVQNLATHLLDEVLACKIYKRVRNKSRIRQHVQLVLLNLCNAYLEDKDKYVAYSRDSHNYAQSTRYNKLFISHSVLMKVIEAYETLDYVENKKGFHDRNSGTGFMARMRAGKKLIKVIKNYSLEKKMIQINPKIKEQESIVLRDNNGKNVEYKDTDETNEMRENLRIINEFIEKTFIGLKVTEDQFEEINNRVLRKEKSAINFNAKKLHRVFNNSDFKQGGRFYGGWWQNIPREYRKFIIIRDLDYSSTDKMSIELDFNAQHAIILYAKVGSEISDIDPYEIVGISRDYRSLIKRAFLTMINANSRSAAEKSINLDLRQRKDLPKKINKAKKLVELIMKRYESISEFFYSGEGVRLQRIDSDIAEQVMLEMMKNNTITLPVHDSFLATRGWNWDLEKIMMKCFERVVGVSCNVSQKQTSREWEYEKNPDKDRGALTGMELFDKYTLNPPKEEFPLYRQHMEEFRREQQLRRDKNNVVGLDP